MKVLKINGDYEQELFSGRGGPKIISESLEFLAFYLSDLPVLSSKSYDPSYLDHVERLTGRRPQLVSKGEIQNWWGPLRDPEFERWMNSKITSAQLTIEKGWNQEVLIAREPGDFKDVSCALPFIVKDPFGMSGRGIREIRALEDLKSVRSFPCILEPLRKRTRDFSHYIWPDGTIITYENLVDRNFQYRGTLFMNVQNPALEELAFYGMVPAAEWERHTTALKEIRSHYERVPLASGYSVDSFVYQENEGCRIQSLCEVNYRRTLGSTAFELSRRFAGGGKWSLFVLAKAERPDFERLRTRTESLPGVILLSPGDVRFQMFLISAPDEKLGTNMYRRLRSLLPECQFAVNIED